MLPRAEQALVDFGKLRDHCLSPTHPRGRHKARVFRAALGLEPSGGARLRAAILVAVATAPGILEGSDRYSGR